MQVPTLNIRRRRIALASALLPATSALAPVGAALAAEPRRVRYILSIPTMSVIVANQTSIPRLLGYYDEESVKVEPVLAGAAGITGAVQLVATGDQDIGSGSLTPVMTRAAEGQDMGISFFYLQVRAYTPVVAVLADSPIKTIKDLKGRLVGVPTLANEGVVVSRYVMRDAGMTPESDLRLIAVGAGAQAAQAMRSAQVDAYVAPRSQVTQLENLGLAFRYLPLPPRLKELFGVGLFARRDFLQKNRATAVGVARAIAKSTLFMLTNPEAAIRLHWKAFPEQVPQGIAPEKALQDALRVLRVQLADLQFQEHETTRQMGFYRPESVAALLEVFGWSGKVGKPESYFNNDLIAEINQFDREKVIAQARNYRVA
jgi:NitT/TauT family transport system substrate-binding protein